MLDIRFVRENPDAVKENIKKKFQEAKLPLVDKVIELDAKNRAVMTEANALRAERNTLSKQVGMLMGQAKKDPSKLAEAEAAKAKVTAQAQRLAELEAEEEKLEGEIRDIMLVIPNMIDPSVPIGPDDSCNVEVQRFGEPVVPEFDIPYHTEIMESFGGIDLDSARRVAGNGFYYLLGDIARLHEAVLAYARDFMIGKGFTYVIPPFMMHGAVVQGVMSFPEMDAMMYKIEGEDLYLIGTSEHTMIGRFVDQIIPEAKLPLTLTSYSPCFRKEKGAHGLEERGVYRIHQFEKQEMIVRLQAGGEHGLVREDVALQRGAVPQPGHPRAPAGVLLRRPGRPEGEELRHRGLEPPPEEVLRGVQLLQPGRGPEPPAENSREGRGWPQLPASHPEQHLRGASADAHRLPGEQPPGGRHREDPRGPAPLHGRQGTAGARSKIKKARSTAAAGKSRRRRLFPTKKY